MKINRDQAIDIRDDIETLLNVDIENIDIALQRGEGLSENPQKSIGLIEKINNEYFTVNGNHLAELVVDVTLSDDDSFPSDESRETKIHVYVDPKNNLLKANF